MSVTPASFRVALPAFADNVTYPDTSIAFWISIAVMMLPQSSWGTPTDTVEPVSPGMVMTNKYDLGTILFVAHNLILEEQSRRAVAAGGVPGLSGAGGPMSSKSVGPVSASYDTTAGLELEGGHWNLTIYGTRFVRLAGMLGTRIITVGGCQPISPYGIGAWPGPPGGLFPGW